MSKKSRCTDVVIKKATQRIKDFYQIVDDTLLNVESKRIVFDIIQFASPNHSNVVTYLKCEWFNILESLLAVSSEVLNRVHDSLKAEKLEDWFVVPFQKVCEIGNKNLSLLKQYINAVKELFKGLIDREDAMYSEAHRVFIREGIPIQSNGREQIVVRLVLQLRKQLQ